MVPVDELPALLLQMVMSLYVGREQHSLRHYDVKLLNFFLKRLTDGVEMSGDGGSTSTSTSGSTTTAISMHYGFGERVFRLCYGGDLCSAGRAWIVKVQSINSMLCTILTGSCS
jgi:hypothetical protein